MSPWIFYDRLIALADAQDFVASVEVGSSWTCVRTQKGRIGLAATAYCGNGKLPDFSAYAGKSLSEVAQKIKSWNFFEASVALAAINACVNQADAFPQDDNPDAFLRYRGLCEGKKVAVVGHFAYLESRLQGLCDLYVLERAPQPGDYPDPACEYLLPDMDVVFITGSAVPNKTMPRLLQLSQKPVCIISGPSTVMNPVLFEYGVDALCGFCVTDRALCDSAVKDQTAVFKCGRMVCLEKEVLNH